MKLVLALTLFFPLATYAAGRLIPGRVCTPEHFQRLTGVGERVATEKKTVPNADRAFSPEEIARDQEYQDKYYGEKGSPASFVPAEIREDALPIFDRIDVANAVDALGGEGHFTPEQLNVLRPLLRARAHGEFGWNEWNAKESTVTRALEAAGLKLTRGDIDRAVTKATALDMRPGLRIIPPRHPGEKGYIDPELVPNAPTIFIKGNPVVRPEVEGSLTALEVQRLLTKAEGAKTAEGILALSDIHAGRPMNEEANLREVMAQVRQNPPATLIVGGDIIDAPSFGGLVGRINAALTDPAKRAAMAPKEAALLEKVLRGRQGKGPLSKAEVESVRRMRMTELVGIMATALPETNIIVQWGNHDLPRLDKVPRKAAPSASVAGFTLEAKDVPEIALTEGGTLPTWADHFKRDLLATMKKGGATEEQLDQVRKMRANTVTEAATKLEIAGFKLTEGELPKVSRNAEGKPTEVWVEDFRAGLYEAMKGKGATPQQLLAVKKMPPELVVQEAQKFYEVKGQIDKVGEMTAFSYYDLKAADGIQTELGAAFPNVSFLGRRSDKYFTLTVGTKENPITILLTHEPQESGPNINRIYKEKPTVYGGQTSWPEAKRLVVLAFDQHAGGSVIGEIERKDGDPIPASVHMVGSLTPNSNGGQRLMGAVMDPATGNVYHITFDNGKGGVGPPEKAEYRQAHYVPPRLKPFRPSALGTTTTEQPKTPKGNN